MKSIFFLLVIFPLTLIGQVTFEAKFTNGATGKPVEGVYCYLLQDNDKWISSAKTNEKGQVSFRYRNEEINPNATYQLEVSSHEFLPLRQTITFNEKLNLTLYPDTTFSEEKKNLVYNGCSNISFGFYRPKEPRSLKDLPDSIQKKLEKHLVDRLGQDYYSKLKLAGGQLVDLQRLYKVEPNAKDYQWTPYSYYICFSFSDEANGIGCYTAKIVLDEKGDVKEEIELPDLKKKPEKKTIISLKEAKEIALARKSYDEKTHIKFSYDKIAGSLTWNFEQRPNAYSSHTLVIDAHSGKVLVP